jgi:hypothetical protein
MSNAEEQVQTIILNLTMPKSYNQPQVEPVDKQQQMRPFNCVCGEKAGCGAGGSCRCGSSAGCGGG